MNGWEQQAKTALGLKNIYTLPDCGMGAAPMNSLGMFVFVYPKSENPHKRPHRVQVICVCERIVPLGRLHQHYRSRRCPGCPTTSKDS